MVVAPGSGLTICPLRHCPFCGGKAEIYHGSFTVQVQCKSCGARSRAFWPSNQSAHDKATRAWNMRYDVKRGVKEE